MKCIATVEESTSKCPDFSLFQGNPDYYIIIMYIFPMHLLRIIQFAVTACIVASSIAPPLALGADSVGAAIRKTDTGKSAPDISPRPVYSSDTTAMQALTPFGISAAKKTTASTPRIGVAAVRAQKAPSAPSTAVTRLRSGCPNPCKLLIRVLIALLFISLVGSFILYIKNRSERTTFVTKTRLSIMDKEVQKACTFIEKNYRKPDLSAESICRDLITGKAFLDALFNQELGIGIETFVAHVRINKARILMDKKPDIDAAAAAAETGFRSTDAFSAAFTTIVGVPFERYRDEQAGHA